MNHNVLFYNDSLSGEKKSYSDLFNEISNERVYYPYCRSSSFYEIFKHIVFSLVLGKEIILLDSDFTDEEIMKLTGDLSIVDNAYSDLCEVSNLEMDTYLERITQNKNTWKITMFTSGTTGLPKKMSHSFESITRFAKIDQRFDNNIWGFAYNPTHMAGIQVFFQAFLNGNSIVRLFGLNRDSVLKQIVGHSITNISATPTFYRLLLPCQQTFPTIRRITTGGEKFDPTTSNQLSTLFPNAKFTNVYASTEAGTLFAANGDTFTIKSTLTELVKVNDDELYIHKSLLGESLGINLDSEWYPTGDIVNVITTNPLSFNFISRKNEMINVGGNKVNPTEVEACIREMIGITDAHVFGKKNSILGNIICCNVIKGNDDITELSIREFLQSRLQEFKIPRMVKFVDYIELTRTGKISRK